MLSSRSKLILAVLGLVASVALGQQRVLDANAAPDLSRLSLAAGYNAVDANAPPGGCHCFSMNGGFVSADYHLNNWLSLSGEFTGSHASHISTLGQNLTLTTYLAGPRVSRPMRRVIPFGEMMFGVAHGADSYFPTATSSTTSASSFALALGGGIEAGLSRHFGLRAIDVQYLHSSLPNGEGDTQNELQISTGVAFHFGTREPAFAARSAPLPQTAQVPEINFTCGATTAEVDAGTAVQIVGETLTLPDQLDVTYKWTTASSAIQSNGRMIVIDTSHLAPGTYRVDGHASLVSDPRIGSNCEASFHVRSAQAPVVAASQPAVVIASRGASDEFSNHVHDIFFDYDVAQIRAAESTTLAEDANYLLAHPDLHVTIAGFADERGSEDYNIALGLKRAIATRTALISLGVDESRMQVVSYGKEKPFCAANTDSCFQSNRRAQLLRDRTALSLDSPPGNQ